MSVQHLKNNFILIILCFIYSSWSDQAKASSSGNMRLTCMGPDSCCLVAFEGTLV